MTQISYPIVTTTVSGAQVAVAQQPQKILIVSQKLAGGTAVSGAINENIQANADTLAGVGSLGAAMVRAVRELNQNTQVDAIFLSDNGAGTAAAGAVVFTGTATESGSFSVIVGSESKQTLSVAVTLGDTATVIGATLAAAVAAATTNLFTAVNTTGSVALTCKHKGTVGNNLPLEVRGTVAGITVALTAFASGATDPILTTALDPAANTRYQTIIWSWANVTTLGTFVDSRFNVTDNILDGLGYTGVADTLANHLSALGALNNLIVYVTDKLENSTYYKGASNLEVPVIQAAYAAAIRALKLTEGAAIASFNVGNSGLDGTGGPALASRPLANSPVYPMIPTRAGRGWTALEVAQLKAVSGTTIGNSRAGNAVVLGDQLTCRRTSGGNPDDSFRYVAYYDTATNIREYYSNNLRSRYAQTRLTDGSPVAGRPMANKRNIEAALIEFYDTLSGPNFALTRAGETNRNFFIANLNVIVNIQTGKVTWSAISPIVTQIRELAGNIQIAFATSADSFTV